ncbi:Cna B-type domain-containing protein, partial [Facklamia sp. P9177]|uniref:Cna B-type domain-containing protein n=1 Tax=Facklamia sp. P9177 TaxID=3421945 RepID=UPI003D171C85
MQKVMQLILTVMLIFSNMVRPIVSYATEVPIVESSLVEETINTDTTNRMEETQEIEENQSQEANETTFVEESIDANQNIDTSKDSDEETKEHLEALTEENKLESNTTDVTNFLSRFSLYIKDGQPQEYVTGREALFYMGLSTTDSALGNGNYTVKINLPKEYVDYDSIVASSTETQGVLFEITEEGNNYVITYKFNNFSSGNSIDLPIRYRTKSGETPNGYQQLITATITNENTDLLGQDSLTINWKTTEIRSRKKINQNLNDGSKINGGLEDSSNPGFLSENLEELNPIPFNLYTEPIRGTPNYGERYFEKVIYRDILPEGAEFVPELNNGWNYDPATHTAEYIYERVLTLGGNRGLNSPVLYLKFPGYEINKPISNTMKATYIPQNKPEYELEINQEDDITFSLISNTNSIGGYKSGRESIVDIPKIKEEFEGYWTLSVTNTNSEIGSNMNKIIMRDHDLDKRFYFSKMKVHRASDEIFKGTVDILFVNEQGEEKTIARDVSIAEADYAVELGKDVKDVIIKYSSSSDENGGLKPSQSLRVTIYSKFRDPSTVNFDEENAKNNKLHNHLTIEANFEGSNTPLELKASEFKELEKIDTGAYLRKTADSSNNTFFIGETVKYKLAPYINKLPKGNSIDFTKVIDLLPNGFEYVANSSKFYSYNIDKIYSINDNQLIANTEPEVVTNYKGTGQTALIWELPSVTSIDHSTYSNTRRSPFFIEYQTKITKLATEGKNENSAYLAWSNNEEVKVLEGSVEDIFDLNDNGSTSDSIAMSKQAITYAPPREVITTKSVKGSLDQNFTLAPGSGFSEINTSAEYNMSVLNNSTKDVEELIILDILPHKGDKTVGTSYESDSRVPRESEFSVQLEGPIQAPEGFQVFYTSDTPSENMKNYTTEANWTSSPSNFTTVKAFKIEMIEGYTLKTEQRASFNVPIKVPNDFDLKLGMKAVNSYGTSLSSNLDYFESNNAILEIVRYQVEGYVFEDTDKNSIRSEDEAVFQSHKVALVDESGNPVTDQEGNPIETLTNDKGYYHFDVFNHGNYRIKIGTPEGYILTEPNLEDAEGSTILDANDGLTDVFTLNRENTIAKRNAGYYSDYAPIQGVKTWDDSDDQNGKRPESITINLLADGVKVDSKIVTAADNWKYRFTGKPIEKDGKKIEYTITEDKVEGYETVIDGFNITNKYVEVVTIEGKKTWDDSNNQDGIRPAEITVNLLANGEKVA